MIDGGFGVARLAPPKEIPEQQVKIWQDTVRAEPPDFFCTGALRALLLDYCRHKAVGDEMSGQIDDFDPAWLAEPKGMRRYEWLLKMRERETRAAANIATKLRLTNQSRYNPRTAKSAGAMESAPLERAPWDVSFAKKKA